MTDKDYLKEKTNEELLALYRQEGRQEIKQELTMRYVYIVRCIAVQMRNVYARSLPMEDIINEGVIVIMKGLDRYDPEKDTKFETYISQRIRGMIIDLVRKQDWLPRDYRKKSREMEDARSSLVQSLGREPTEEELAEPEPEKEEPMATEESAAEPEPEKEEPMVTEEPAAEPEPEKEVVIQEVKSPSFFNLMERLLERQDIEKYMSQYNVCKCPKCIADVKARTLTNLPAKYISSEGGFEEASMNFYENKYKIRMLTELIRACIAVRNNPRHDNN